jgi:hypothetical protein
VWTHPLFQEVLLGGSSGAVGNVETGVSPNLQKAAPGYAELPPKPA